MAQKDTAAKPKQAKQIRKISVATVAGKVDLKKLIDAEKIALMNVYGIATSKKIIATDYGDAVRFIGQFRAVNLETGELFQSSRMYLPSAMADDLDGALSGGGTAEFAVRVSVIYDDTVASKYYYDGEDLVKPANNDAMLALESKMQTAAKALPNPNKK